MFPLRGGDIGWPQRLPPFEAVETAGSMDQPSVTGPHHAADVSEQAVKRASVHQIALCTVRQGEQAIALCNVSLVHRIKIVDADVDKDIARLQVGDHGKPEFEVLDVPDGRLAINAGVDHHDLPAVTAEFLAQDGGPGLRLVDEALVGGAAPNGQNIDLRGIVVFAAQSVTVTLVVDDAAARVEIGGIETALVVLGDDQIAVTRTEHPAAEYNLRRKQDDKDHPQVDGDGPGPSAATFRPRHGRPLGWAVESHPRPDTAPRWRQAILRNAATKADTKAGISKKPCPRPTGVH